MPQEEVRTSHLLILALLSTLLLLTFERAFTRIFILNFSTAGPNATALLVLLLVTGWTVPAAARVTRWEPRVLLTGLVVVAAVALLLTLSPLVRLAGLAAVLFHVATLPVLVALVHGLREEAAVAGALGVAAYQAARALVDTAPLYATPAGQVVLVGLTLLLLVAWGRLVRRHAVPPLPERGLTVHVGPLWAFLLLEVSFLGAQAVAAEWMLRSVLVVVLASTVGLAAGAWWVGERGVPGDLGAAWPWAALLLVALADLLWWDLTGGLAVAPAQMAAVVLLAVGTRATRPLAPGRYGAKLAGVQLAGVALLFLVVSAGNWAFMPSPLDVLTRGRAALFLLLLGTLLPVLALLRAWEEREEVGAEVAA